MTDETGVTDAKQRLLIYSDSPTWPSGLGRITRALLKHFSGRYELGVLGWGYKGNKHGFPCHIYSVKKHDLSDRAVTFGACEDFKPDIVLTVGDPWDFPHMPTVLSQLHSQGKKVRWYWVSLIDGHPLLKEWLPIFSRVDGLGVTSEYGSEAIKELDQMLDPMLMRLGVDSDFWRIDEPKSILVNSGGPRGQRKFTRENTFMVFWIGVNSNRKNLDALIRGTKQLLRDHEDAYLMMQICYDTPSGFDIMKIQGYENLPPGQVGLGLSPPMTGIQDAQILQYYGVASVVACTSCGEGNWLPGYEAQACGCIPVATNFSALPETLGTDGSRGVLIPTAYEGYGENTMLRGMIDIGKLGEALEGLYQDWKAGGVRIEKMRKAGRRWAEFHSWTRFCDKVEKLMERKQAAIEISAPPRDWVVEKVEIATVKTGMLCPTFQKNCGIGEYSRGLVAGMHDIGFFPEQYATYAPEAVAQFCIDNDVKLLHVQHEFSFFDQWKLESMLRLLRAAGIASVITAHSILDREDLMSPLCRNADLILVHSKNQLDLLKQHGGTARSCMVPGGSAPVRLLNRGRLRAAQGYGADDFVIGSHGFLRPQKGYDVLLNALQYLPENVKLMIFASPHEFGSSHYDEEFIKTIEKMGPERVTLIRERLENKSQMINLLHVADVLALTCHESEGIGISSASKDCASAGRPMLLSRVGTFDDVPETIEVNGKPTELAVRVDDDDHMAVAEEIKKLMADPQRVARMSNASRAWAWSIEWRKVAGLHCELYEALLEGRDVEEIANAFGKS